MCDLPSLVLTQPPVSSVSPFTHCGCQKAPGQLLSIPQILLALHLVMKERAKLDLFQESKK